jgi:large subunit ribosomal protein L6
MAKRNDKPIILPPGISVTSSGNELVVAGPGGVLKQHIPTDKTAAARGLVRALTLSLIKGLTEGYEKKLELVGAGYRARVEGNSLVLAVGRSHPVVIEQPEGIVLGVEENTKISVKGKDKQLVGEVAAKIRRVRPPEPYKGKGIRYAGEVVRHKAGKAAKVGAAGGTGTGTGGGA